MAKGFKNYDAAVIGGLLGLLVAKPDYAVKANSWFAGLIPTTWNWFGDLTIVVIFVGLGLLVGYLADRS